MKLKKMLAALCTSALIAGAAVIGIASAAHASGSDSPTPYTVDATGITLPSGATFPDGGHVNIKTSAGDKGIHFESLNWPDDNPKKYYIGKSFIPWSAFGLTGCFTVTWVQISMYNEHFGDGGQSPIQVGDCGEETPNKVYVCKYVGTPGVNETLQTGNNPIEVSVNAIPGWDGTTIPFPFADAQGKSVVIAFSDGPGGGQGDEPDLSDCPTPEGPPTEEPECITAAWLMPGPWVEGQASWPQTLIGFEPRACGDLTWPTPECGISIQIDSYNDNAITTALLTPGRVLNGPNNPPESLWSGSPAWRFVYGGDCPPPPVNECVAGVGETFTNANPMIETPGANLGTYTVEYVEGAVELTVADGNSKINLSSGNPGFALHDLGVLDIQATDLHDASDPSGGLGLNLYVDFDNDGDVDGTLVYEEVYEQGSEQDLWLTGGSAQFVKDAAPDTSGGFGSGWHGTANEWLTEFPDAEVVDWAVNLGRFTDSSWSLTQVGINCAVFDYDLYVEPEPDPEVVTPEAPEATDVCGTEDDGYTIPEDTEEFDYSLFNDDRESGVGEVTIIAEPNEGFEVATPGEGDTYEVVEGVAVWTFDFTNEACPTPTPKPPVTQGLANTGAEIGAGVLAALALLIGGGVALGIRARKSA